MKVFGHVNQSYILIDVKNETALTQYATSIWNTMGYLHQFKEIADRACWVTKY